MLYDKTCIIPQRLYHADNFHLLFHLDKMEEIDLYNICIKTKWIKKSAANQKCITRNLPRGFLMCE